MAQDNTKSFVMYQGDGVNNVFSVPMDKGFYGKISVAFVRRGLDKYFQKPTTFTLNEDNSLLTWTGEPLQIGDYIVIERTTLRQQPYVFPNNQKPIEKSDDNMERQIQEISDRVDQALKIDPTYAIDSDKMSPIDWLQTILRSKDRSVREIRFMNGQLFYSCVDPESAEEEKSWTALPNAFGFISFRYQVYNKDERQYRYIEATTDGKDWFPVSGILPSEAGIVSETIESLEWQANDEGVESLYLELLNGQTVEIPGNFFEKLAEEEQRAKSAEQDLRAQIETEAATRNEADIELHNGLNNLGNRIQSVEEKIPEAASADNQLADKAFVNSSVQTATANFRGNWATWAEVPTDSNSYPVDYAGSKVPTVNDYLVVADASGFAGQSLIGTWRFKYSGVWATDGKAGWLPEYQVNEEPLTMAQLAALNSGITAEKVAGLESSIAQNAQDIVVETNRAKSAEEALQSSVESKASATALNEEIARAKAEELALQNALDTKADKDSISDFDVFVSGTIEDKKTRIYLAGNQVGKYVVAAFSGEEMSINTGYYNKYNGKTLYILNTSFAPDNAIVTTQKEFPNGVDSYDAELMVKQIFASVSPNALETVRQNLQSEIDTNAGKTAELDADLKAGLEAKVDKNQGIDNAGLVLKVGADGEVIPGEGSAPSDGITITENASRQIQAIGVIEKNTGAVKYDWVGTLQDYQDQNIETEHPEWICYITDDVSGGESVYTKTETDEKFVARGHELIAVQIPTAANSYTWYRKYSDGWVEQGGQMTIPAITAGAVADVTVTVPIKMSNNQYNRAAFPNQDNSNSWSMRCYATNMSTSTAVVFSMLSKDTLEHSAPWFWEVKGYAA